MKDPEHQMQVACVNWFRMQYRKYQLLLFAIPNGGHRNRIVAAKLKAEGVVAGVADLFLSVPSNRFFGLYIEMKIKPNNQTDSQKAFQSMVEKQGYRYEVVYNFDQFEKLINEYLKN